ncbi:sugar phosphate isomerase/epimerase family protein [Natrarchaeobius oligotrophus]|uniref:Sugar phosphate isomerase/epimerase n=1 Tax=Natrarchaeobius chitinivorans TaxID=1679083 RepID=A0A3N6M6I8_NATCH|nr:sugar phosphate isomerase/epimerase [Natrarchaeobius chitinivorans]RQG99203.1 sugar phosphate isomerase/epimerase [Natrarchaeobius chitinivorans]
MVESAIQLYTLRNADVPFGELLERVADAGFDGVEFAYRVTDENPDAVRETLEEIGLAVAGAHVPIESFEEEFDDTVAFYETLGCDEIVVPWLDQEWFASREGLGSGIERLEALEDRLADRGITLHYHNHDHEYVALDEGNAEDNEEGIGDNEGGAGKEPHTGFHAFVERSEVDLELDLGFVLKAGDDPVELLRAVDGRCRLAHVKDVDIDSGELVPVGTGDLDLAGCADAFRDCGGEWLIYEWEGDDPLASLEDAAATMDELV